MGRERTSIPGTDAAAARAVRGPFLILRAAALAVLAACALAAAAPADQSQPSAVQPVPSARAAKNVVIIPITGPIDRWTAFGVQRRLARAEREGADAVVFEIDTPGGNVMAVLAICNLIKGSSISNTVAWINHDAYSGGAIIALACREIVVHDYATFGDALPVAAAPLVGMVPIPEAEREKIMGPLLLEVVDSARRNNYDEMLVQGVVRRGVELWLIENPATGARYFVTEAEYRAAVGGEPARVNPTLPSVTGPSGGADATPGQAAAPGSDSPPQHGGADPLAFRPAAGAMDPRAVREINEGLELRASRSSRPDFRTPEHAGRYRVVEYVSDGHGIFVLKSEQLIRFGLATQKVRDEDQLRAYFGAQNIVRLGPTWSEGLARAMTLPWVRGLLIVVFLICLFLEMSSPGVSVPGAIAAAALIGLVVPPLLVDMAAWWEVAAIVAGVALIAMELFVIPGFGVCGVLGVVLLFGGLVATFVGGDGRLFPGANPDRSSELTWGVVTVLVSALTSGGIIYMIAKHLPSTPLLGRLVLKESLGGPEPTMLEAMAATAALARVGDVGRAITPLRPAGRVQMGERIIDAVSDLGFIPAGAQVRVTSSDPFRIGVEMVDDVPPHGAAQGASLA